MSKLVVEETRGFADDMALRERYEKQGFGLESAFEKEEWARARIVELRKEYGFTLGEIRLVKHIFTRYPRRVARVTWVVYAKEGKGINVVFPSSEL